MELPLAPEALPIVTLALGLATSEAITEVTGLSCDIRWPNDILIGGKKAAGILVHMVDYAAIAGIGINVNHTSFPSTLTAEATSLSRATGRAQDREYLLTCLLASVERVCGILASGGQAAILKMFSDASTYANGKSVTVDLGNSIIDGTTAGLTDAGFLLVRKRDGSVEMVISGGVRPA